jgi:hypothetical protein
MIRRPISQRFVEAVRTGRKITTIRPNPWPLNRPIMLYHWSGKAYASPQVEVCAVVVVDAAIIQIIHGKQGMEYHYCWSMRETMPTTETLFQAEGFTSQEELDAWFSAIVEPGREIIRSIMKFRLATPAELTGETK